MRPSSLLLSAAPHFLNLLLHSGFRHPNPLFSPANTILLCSKLLTPQCCLSVVLQLSLKGEVYPSTRDYCHLCKKTDENLLYSPLGGRACNPPGAQHLTLRYKCSLCRSPDLKVLNSTLLWSSSFASSSKTVCIKCPECWISNKLNEASPKISVWW